MRNSIKLFRVFGISVEMHISFLILPVLFWLTLGIKGVALILGVFVCVTLHELCHALQAKKFGVKADRIILLPIGGVASMGSIPDKPYQEFRIAIAGPLFNIILAAILYYPAYRFLGPDIFFSMNLATWPHVIAYLYWLNILLAVFNLLPAFPMDGGRILRALLARVMTLQKATRIAVGFGYLFIFLFVAWGIMVGNIWLLIIAFFVYISATQEASHVEITETLKRLKVRDILPDGYLSVEPDTKLSKVLEMVFHSHQEDFPVMESGLLAGIVTRADIISAIHQFGVDKTVGDIMTRNFPAAGPSDSLTKIHKLMEESGLRAIPIMEAGKLLGLITMEDLGKIYALMSAREGAK